MAEDIIKAKIVFDNAGIGKFASGGRSGSSNITGSFGPGIGKIAGGVALGVAALEGIKKGIGALVNASPRLQASLKILGKSFELLLRPIGDTLSVILRPIFLALLQFSIKTYQLFRNLFGGKGDKKGAGADVVEKAVGALGDSDTGKNQEMRDALEENSDLFGGLTNVMTLFADIILIVKGALEGLWGILKGLAGVFILLTKLSLFLMEKALGPIGPIISLIADAFVSLGGFLNDIGTAIWDLATGGSWDAFVEAIIEAFSKLGSNLLESIKNFWNSMVKVFTSEWNKAKKLWDTVVTFLGEVANSFWEFVKGRIVNAIDNVKLAFDRVKSAIKGAIEWITNLINIFTRRNSSGNKGSVSGNDVLITNSGKSINLHPDDNVLAFKGNAATGGPNIGGGKSVSITNQITIQALDASSIDRSVIDKISRSVAETVARSFGGITTEYSGAF